MRLGLLLLALALAASCRDRGHPYPPEVSENFMRACTAQGGTDAGCGCSLDAVRRRYTIDEYRAIEGRVARGEIPPELANLTADCRGR